MQKTSSNSLFPVTLRLAPFAFPHILFIQVVSWLPLTQCYQLKKEAIFYIKTSQCVKLTTMIMQPALPKKIGVGVKLVIFKDVLQSDLLFCVDFVGFDKECFLMEDIGNLYYCTDFV